MRAREFVNENVHTRLDINDPSLSRAMVFPDVDKYYQFYRMSLDLAQIGADGKIENPRSTEPVNDDPAAFAYTDHEAEMLNKVAKLRGYKTKVTSAGKSKEFSDTHVVSPVAKFKPTKRKSS